MSTIDRLAKPVFIKALPPSSACPNVIPLRTTVRRSLLIGTRPGSLG